MSSSRRFLCFAIVTVAGLLALGAAGAAAGKSGAAVRNVQALDACDPATFNAAVGAGTCTRNGGGLPFDQFIAQRQKHGGAAAWRFSPGRLTLDSGGSLEVTNRGGEDHTFTEVANFGGGCVKALNDILGLTPVPESRRTWADGQNAHRAGSDP